jgi:phosphohistidine phosphatase
MPNKTLIITRHAKASRNDPRLDDFARPLNERGEREAEIMGAVLKKERLIPDLIISSPAQRAKRTSEILALACGYPGAIQWQKTFYLAGPSDYTEVLAMAPDACKTIMIVGHNPGLESLLQTLIGREEHLPAAGIACLDLRLDHWKEISILHPGNTPAELRHLWRPDEI